MMRTMLTVIMVAVLNAAAAGQPVPERAVAERPAAAAELVLRADSPMVDIQDGARLWKGIWTIDPTVALDVYNASRDARPKRVTFISDVDRLSIDVEPNRTYDFVVMLKGQACRTRVSTMTQPLKRVMHAEAGTDVATSPAASAKPITIPFRLENDRIMLTGSVNGSSALNLCFDTGADGTVLFATAIEKGAKVELDGSQANSGLGGTVVRRTASGNSIEIPVAESSVGIKTIRWDHEQVIFNEQNAWCGDGILGIHVFEDKVVEINFDRRVLVIHDAVPAKVAGYPRLEMEGGGRVFSIQTQLATARGGTAKPGSALFDTGCTTSMIVYRDMAGTMGLHGALSRVGRSVSGGTGPGKVECDIMLLPELTVAGVTMKTVPIQVEAPERGADGKQTGSPHSGAVIGMDVLKRFNIVLDYPGDQVVLMPNSLMASPYSVVLKGPPWPVIGAAAAGMLGLVGGGVWWVSGRVRSRGQA